MIVANDVSRDDFGMESDDNEVDDFLPKWRAGNNFAREKNRSRASLLKIISKHVRKMFDKKIVMITDTM